MPTLKQLTCKIEWTGSETALKEYGTTYKDGFVQTYVTVPTISGSSPFAIHLTSKGYIAPGLAMFVFMDGVYQCNRNQQGLKMPAEAGGKPGFRTEIDFRVRQKESKISDGVYLGKEWRFEKIKIVDEDEKHRAYLTPGSFEYIGIIEVVVLRCQDAYAGISKSASPIARRDSMTSGGRHWNDGPQPAERHEDPVSPMKRSTTHEEGFLSGLFDGCGDTYRWDVSKQSQEVRTTRNSSYEFKSQDRPHRSAAQFSPGVGDRSPPACAAPAVLIQVGTGLYRPQAQAGSHYRNDGGGLVDGGTSTYRPTFNSQQAHSASHGPHEHQHGSVRGIPGQHTSVAGLMSETNPAGKQQTSQGFGLHRPNDDPWGSSNDQTPSVDQWGSNEVKPGSGDLWGSANIEQPLRDLWASDGDQGLQDRGGEACGDCWGKRSGRSHRDNSNGNEPWGQDSRTRKGQRDDDHDCWTMGQSRDDCDDTRSRSSKKSTSGNSQWGATRNGQRDVNSKEAVTTPGAMWGASTNWEPGKRGVGYQDRNSDNTWGSDPWSGNVGNPKKTTDDVRSRSGTGGKVPNWGSCSNGGQQSRNAEGQQKAGFVPAFGGIGSEYHANSKPAKDSWNAGADHGSQHNWYGKTADAGDQTGPTQEASDPYEAREDVYDNPSKNWDTTGTGDNLNGTQYGAGRQASAPDEALPSQANLQQTFQTMKDEVGAVRNYWSSWKCGHSSERLSDPLSGVQRSAGVFIADEEPLYAVPKKIVEQNLASHQVQPGRSAMYIHQHHRPMYIDTLAEPYAVFVFRYRSRDVLEKMLGIKIVDDAEDEKQRLLSLSKEQIIEELLESKLG